MRPDNRNNDFTEIYKRFYVPLINFARHKTGDIHIAEDLVHELFADLYHQDYSMNNIEAYLFSALKRRILNHWRHQEVRKKYQTEKKPDNIETGTLRRIELKDIMNGVYAHVETLSPQCRKVFYMKKAELSNKEIASEMNISVKTVEAH